MRLEGKLALVTGAGIGIGRETAVEFARQGADVALSYHTSKAGADAAAAEIRAMGRRAATVRADLGIVRECRVLVDQVIEYLGGLDVLVNNAGLTADHDFLQVEEKEFDRLYAINIRGQYFCAQQAARHMSAHGGGVIINMTSIHGLKSFPRHTLYDGTKGAIVAWTRALALELAPHGIRAVAVAPGAIEVPRYADIPNYGREALARQIPRGRVGVPQDIAKTCAFLASEDADFIVGTTVVCDGGTKSRMALYVDSG